MLCFGLEVPKYVFKNCYCYYYYNNYYYIILLLSIFHTSFLISLGLYSFCTGHSVQDPSTMSKEVKIFNEFSLSTILFLSCKIHQEQHFKSTFDSARHFCPNKTLLTLICHPLPHTTHADGFTVLSAGRYWDDYGTMVEISIIQNRPSSISFIGETQFLAGKR